MAAHNTIEPKDPKVTPQEIGIVLPAAVYPGEEVIGTVELEEINVSGFDLTEFGLSAQPNYSGLTAMGRFLADGGIGRMENLIRPSVPVQFSATKKRARKRRSKRKKASSVVVEVGSVCSLDSGRIKRDFGEK